MGKLLLSSVCLAIVLTLTACNRSKPETEQGLRSPDRMPGSQLAETLTTKEYSIQVERLAQLSEPWGMDYLPNGTLLITEKPGRLRTYSNGTLSEPLNGVPKVAYRDQGGLLDVAVDPNFAQNSFIYLSYAEPAEEQPANAEMIPDPRLGPFVQKDDNVLKGGAVARARLNGNNLEGLMVIWRQDPRIIGLGHFGGRLLFGKDGKLFITSGERQRFEPAQDMNQTLGKIIRINPDGSIPPDNPFENQPGARGEIWSLGHRNSLGLVLDPANEQLWEIEMGPAHGDELNLIEPGKNYGWPLVSNGDNYDGSPIPDHATRPEFAAPVFYWHPAISPSGLTFYTGEMFAAWKGNMLMGGLSAESLVRLVVKNNRVESEERISMRRRIRDVQQATDGAVLLLTDAKDGELLRLTPISRPQSGS